MTIDPHSGWRSRGHLPHFDAPGLVQHVVFRLADSLPSHIRDSLANTPRADRVEAVDTALDRGYGRRDLIIPEVAHIIEQALLRFDGERYLLIAWCVMPNHVHVLLEAGGGTASIGSSIHGNPTRRMPPIGCWGEPDPFGGRNISTGICETKLT
jgi:putative transposase